jgi:hypothetical protein
MVMLVFLVFWGLLVVSPLGGCVRHQELEKATPPSFFGMAHIDTQSHVTLRREEDEQQQLKHSVPAGSTCVEVLAGDNLR